MNDTIKRASTPAAALDPTKAVEDPLRSLKTHTEGLSSQEAQRRLAQYGPNQLPRREGMNWPRELARPLTHPLAPLLWMAALSFIVGSITVDVAVALIIVLNAAVAFVQERHAEDAVEALGRSVQPPLPAVGDRGLARDRRRVRVRLSVSGAACQGRPTRTRHAAADPVPVHRLGRGRAPQVGDPNPVLAARAGRHTSTRRLTFGRTRNEYESRKAPSNSAASTRWPLAAVACDSIHDGTLAHGIPRLMTRAHGARLLGAREASPASPPNRMVALNWSRERIIARTKRAERIARGKRADCRRCRTSATLPRPARVPRRVSVLLERGERERADASTLGGGSPPENL